MSECIGVTFIWRSEKNKILNSNIEVSAVVKMNSCLIIDVNNLWFVLNPQCCIYVIFKKNKFINITSTVSDKM